MDMNRVILTYSYLPRRLPAARRAALAALLPYGRRLRLRGALHGQSQTLLGIALACRALGRVARRRVWPAELRFPTRGKPYAPLLPAFNIAHAGAWVVCAVAERGDVGVDIESTPGAIGAPMPWTLREATLKAAGVGLTHKAQSVRVAPAAAGSGSAEQRVEYQGRHWYWRAAPAPAATAVHVVASLPMRRLRSSTLPARQVVDELLRAARALRAAS